MAPSCRSRWVHMPIRRGSRYLYWASSTWSRPSRVRARWAKMSRIRAERSSTDTPRSSDKTLCWEGDRPLSKITMSASMAWASSFTSATLPSPMKVRGSGLSLDWVTTPTHSPPAVSSRAESSSMDASSAFSSGARAREDRPTSTALFFFSVLFSVIDPPKWDFPRLSGGGPGAEALISSAPPRPLRYTWYGSPSQDKICPWHPGGWPGGPSPGHSACGRPAPAPPPQNRGPRTRPGPR